MLVCKCSDCGRDFYTKEPREALEDEVVTGDGIIDDQEELRVAEDEVRRQVDEDGDHRYR